MKKLSLVIGLVAMTLTGFAQVTPTNTLNEGWGIGVTLSLGMASGIQTDILYVGENGGFVGSLGVGLSGDSYGEDYTGTIDYNMFNDPSEGTTSQSGLNVTLSPALRVGKAKKTLIYAGLKIEGYTEYQQLYDPMHILSSNGEYRYEKGGGANLGVSAGFVTPISHNILFKGGVNGVKGFNADLGLIFTF